MVSMGDANANTWCKRAFMLRPHQLAIFDLREISKIQLHIVPSYDIQMCKIITDLEFKEDA